MIHEALDAVFEESNVKIDEEAKFTARQFEVGDDLSAMDIVEGFHRLDFNDDASLKSKSTR